MKRIVAAVILLLVCGHLLAQEMSERDAAETVLGSVTIDGVFPEHYLKLNQQVILEIYGATYIDAAYPNVKKAELLLIGYEDGGVSCPIHFRVLDLRGGQATLSSEFGTCGALSRPPRYMGVRIRANPIYINDEWRIAVNDDNGPQWFTYKEGTVYEHKKGKLVEVPGGEEYRYEKKLAIELPQEEERTKLIEKYGSAKKAYFSILDEKAKAVGNSLK